MRAPFAWFGSKARLSKKFLKYIPEHKVYVEAFGGTGALLLNKDCVPIEVYNDLDSALVDFFTVIRDPELFCRFYHLMIHTPYSRGIWLKYREEWKEEEDIVTRVYKWHYVAQGSFSGDFANSWSYSVEASSKNMPQRVSSWLSLFKAIPLIAERFMTVQIECLDGIRLIKKYDTLDTFFYLDPPYLKTTREKSGKYVFECGDDYHIGLLECIKNVIGKVMISSYDNELYNEELKKWNKKEFRTIRTSVGKVRTNNLVGAGVTQRGDLEHYKNECIWMNY